MNYLFILLSYIIGILSGSFIYIFITKFSYENFIINFTSTFFGVLLGAIFSWILYWIKQNNQKKEYKKIVEKDLEDKKETFEGIITTYQEKVEPIIKELEKEEKIEDEKLEELKCYITEYKIQISAFLNSISFESIIYSGQIEVFSEELMKTYQQTNLAKNIIIFISDKMDKESYYLNSDKFKKDNFDIHKKNIKSFIEHIKKSKTNCEKSLIVLNK